MTESESQTFESHGEYERLKDEELFRFVLERQAAIAQNIQRTANEAFIVAQEETLKLDERAIEAGVIGEVATLTGEAIQFGSVHVDGLSGSIRIEHDLLTNTDKTNPFLPSKNGTFNGFTAAWAAAPNRAGFIPTIEYQIALVQIAQPAYYGTLLAHGPVATTNLEFIEDRKAEDALSAFEKLHEIKDTKTTTMLRTLNDLLEQYDAAQLDEKELRFIGRFVRTHLGNQQPTLNLRHKDALLDLVRAKLGLYDDQLFRIVATSSMEVVPPQYGHSIRESLDTKAAIMGLSFTPYHWWSNESWQVDSDQDALSIILADTSRNPSPIMSVPFEALTMLRPIVTKRPIS